MKSIKEFFGCVSRENVPEEVLQEQQLSLCIPKIPWKTPFKFTSGIIAINQCACTLPNTFCIVIDGGTSAEAIGKDIEANLSEPVSHWEVGTDYDDFECWEMMIRMEKNK